MKCGTESEIKVRERSMNPIKHTDMDAHQGMYSTIVLSYQTSSSNNTREDSTHRHHQMVSTEIRLIIFFPPKMEKLFTVSNNKTES